MAKRKRSTAARQLRIYPHVRSTNTPLQVRTYLWLPRPNREFIDEQGNTVRITNLDEARSYAAEHGYHGIHVTYC